MHIFTKRTNVAITPKKIEIDRSSLKHIVKLYFRSVEDMQGKQWEDTVYQYTPMRLYPKLLENKLLPLKVIAYDYDSGTRYWHFIAENREHNIFAFSVDNRTFTGVKNASSMLNEGSHHCFVLHTPDIILDSVNVESDTYFIGYIANWSSIQVLPNASDNH